MQKRYIQNPTLRGIGGGMDVVSYLSSANLYLERKIVTIDLQIVENLSFELLLG